MEECKICAYNRSILDKINTAKPGAEMINALADTFKVFGDGTRIRILLAMFAGELSVSDISAKLDMSQSAISHQLRTLKDARLIRPRREGKNTFYALDDEHVKKIIEQVLIHIGEDHEI